MARISQDEFSGQVDTSSTNTSTINAHEGATIALPNSGFIADAEISRDGQDLVLNSENGESITITNYFSTEPTPLIEAPDGSVLTPNLVNSFLQSSDQYAQSSSMTDESPVGAVEEIKGDAKVIRADGTTENITLGTPIYNGDVIETSAKGAVNIVFIDETSMAVSENARLSVDEYKFDPTTESGETNFSVLRGVFVFTSGLIGRDDPDDVKIETPVGSIGIRGTIIAGKIQPGGDSEITVVEGAIVITNGAMEKTLSIQYESIKLGGFNDNIQDMGVKDAADVSKTYGSVSDVVPRLFSSINDNIKQESNNKNETKTDSVSEEVILEETIENNEQNQQQDQNLEPSPDEINFNILEQSETFNVANEINVERNDDIKDPARDLNFKSLAEGRNNNSDPDNFNSTFLNKNNGTNVKSPVSATAADGSKYLITAGNPNAHKISADINGDGTLDTASIDFGTGKLQVLNGASQAVSLSTTANLKQISLAGDINNDGFADLIASNPNTGTDNGTTYEFLGGTSLLTTPSSVPSIITNEKRGQSLSGIGDFDGDGKSDYAVGITGASAQDGKVELNLSDSGIVNINGAAANGGGLGAKIAGIGDINGDGLSDVLSSYQNNILDKTVEITFGNTGGSTSGFNITGASEIIAIGAAGDMNGDGFDDFAISMRDGTDISTYVIFGQNGFSNMTMTDLDNANNAIKITHKNVDPAAEYSINSVGDKDGNGFDDLQIGVVGGPQFTVHGRQTDPALVMDDNANDSNGNTNEITAGSNSQSLVGDATEFYDATKTDLSMRGGGSDNTFNINNTFKNIDGGNGTDTISYFSGGGTLDFSALNYEAISQIEKIEFGANSQIIKLTAENIFNLLKSSDNGTLTIENKAGVTGSDLKIDAANIVGATSIDKVVNALNEQGIGATYQSSAGGYDHYQIGGYNLYIDSSVNTTVI